MQHPAIRLMITFLLLVAAVSFGPASAQETEIRAPGRRLENLIPSHLPLKIVEVRNVQGKHWLRDLEVEVKNTSDRPIYYVGLRLILPDVRPGGGSKYGVPINYGSINGHSIRTFRAEPEAPSLKPGEGTVLRVGEPIWRGHEAYVLRANVRDAETERVWLQFRGLSFGDGRGFENADGAPVPRR